MTSPRWLYWLSLLLIGLPVLFVIGAVHERIVGTEPGTIAGWLYVGAAFAVAAVVRFGVHVLWDALQLHARLASRRERHPYEEDT